MKSFQVHHKKKEEEEAESRRRRNENRMKREREKRGNEPENISLKSEDAFKGI